MTGSPLGRGALIVFEGCDRAGKTTQCKKLIDAFRTRKIPAKLINFPDRTTATGKVINGYLEKKQELSDQAIHLLFSANRWEAEPTMRSLLLEGVTLVVDRYSYSGVAFSSGKEGIDLEWCKRPEAGLPKPDLVFFLHLSPEVISRRSGFGEERYEVSEFQEKVHKNFLHLHDNTWKVIDAEKDIDVLHEEILKHSLEAVKNSKDSPLRKLWLIEEMEGKV